MTLLLTIILAFFCHPDDPLAGGQNYSCNRHSDESQNLPLAITQIPDQVRNDGTAIVILMPPLTVILALPAVILTKVRICVLVFLKQILNQVQNDDNSNCHPDENQDLSLSLTQIPDQVRNDGAAVVILTKVRIFFNPELNSG